MKAEIAAKSFNGTPVLGPISLSLAAGRVLALTGPSGIGKSTLVRIVAGLERDFSGTVSGAGRIGMVFQNPTLLPWRSVLDNVMVATGCDAGLARDTLEQVELGARLADFPRQLSLGQQRRVALARALAARPQTLILDEAFASLDEATARRMRALTGRILDGQGFRTILVTHNPRDAVELADRVILLGGAPAQIRVTHDIAAPRASRDISAETARFRQKMSPPRTDAAP